MSLRFILVLALCAYVTAESWHWNFFVNPETYKNRTFPLTDEAPFAATLDTHARGKRAIQLLTKLFEDEETTLREKASQWRYSALEGNPCTPFKPSILEAVNNSAFSRGFGEIDNPCVGEIHLSLKQPQKQALFDFLGAVEDVRAEVLRKLDSVLKALDPPWNETHLFSTFNYKDSLHQCALKHITGFRVNGTWSLSSDYTNAIPTHYLPNTMRMYIAENVYPTKDGRLSALRMNVRDKTGVTTTLARWGGTPAFSRFRNTAPLEENPAVAGALGVQDSQREQAENFLSSTNVAILLLPIVTAFVPVALFADVDLFAAFLYLLITDVWAMVPLAIHGVELILFAQVVPEHTHLRLYTPSGERTVSAAEMWHCSCVPTRENLVKGCVFLLTSMLLAGTGVSLEIYARHRLVLVKQLTIAVKSKDGGTKNVQLWNRMVSSSDGHQGDRDDSAVWEGIVPFDIKRCCNHDTDHVPESSSSVCTERNKKTAIGF